MKDFFYEWDGVNTWLFYTINGWHNDTLDGAMQLGTLLGDHNRFALYLAALALVAWWQVTRGGEARRWLGVLTVFSLAYVLDGVLIGWLKHAFDFPRPYGVLPPETVHIVGVVETKHSFPSGHATFAATCAASLWPLLGRYGRVAATAFVIWVAWSRISLGMHFPADVIAGALLAIVIVISLERGLHVLWRRFGSGHPPTAATRSRRKRRTQTTA